MGIEQKILTFGTGKVGTVGGKLMGWDTYYQAKAFIQVANITDPTQITAINYLVKELVDNNLMSKFRVIYPMIGGDATKHRYNLVDTGAFQLTFVGGWTHGANGALPNGVNAYATTGFVPSTITENNMHFSYYSRTNSQILNEFLMGGSSPGPAFPILYLRIRNEGNESIACVGSTESNQPTAYGTLDSRGLFTGNFQSNTLRQLIKNKTILNQNTVNQALSKPTLPIFLGSWNNGTAVTFTNKECAFASLGNGMTNVEQALFYDIVQAYQTILTRNV